jgi:hypothetical protein
LPIEPDQHTTREVSNRLGGIVGNRDGTKGLGLGMKEELQLVGGGGWDYEQQEK